MMVTPMPRVGILLHTLFADLTPEPTQVCDDCKECMTDAGLDNNVC